MRSSDANVAAFHSAISSAESACMRAGSRRGLYAYVRDVDGRDAVTEEYVGGAVVVLVEGGRAVATVDGADESRFCE